MTRVSGIGGIFFRAEDPATLGRWYEDVLGVDVLERIWIQTEGPTVLAPFPKDTDYFDRPEQQWMINFRVTDLDAMIAKLRERGISVTTNPDWNSEAGRFARIHDPEGNPIELWEPAQRQA